MRRYQAFAKALRRYAQGEAVRAELDHRQRLAQVSVPTLPLYHPGGAKTIATSRTVTLTLNAEETARLLKKVPEAYHTEVNDVLLTALALSVGEWLHHPTPPPRGLAVASDQLQLPGPVQRGTEDLPDEHLNIAELYRTKIERFAEALIDPEASRAAAEHIRSLVVALAQALPDLNLWISSVPERG